MTAHGKNRHAGWPFLALLLPVTLLAACYLAWRALAAVDFLYPWLYAHAGLHENIERYAPENRYRAGFERTTPAERQRLFAAIGDAVRHGGRGLETLQYRDPEGRVIGLLLRPVEVTHLRDVARLVTWLERAGLVALAGWVALVLAMRLRRLVLPPVGRLVLVTLAGIGGVTALVLAAGPVEVFYAAHRAIFPPDHEWFFYYQDSLMSTMMKAPDLFGWIAAALVGLGLGLDAAMLAAARRLTRPQPA